MISEFINKTFQMDNLELLKELPDNSIDLIYCDILYNTGKKFKDYEDRLGTPQEAIGWYKPRLVEMKRVLKDTGTIYLHCDYRLVHYLKVEMDKIFGLDNFRNDIAWCYSSPSGSRKDFPRKHDRILRYSKTDGYTWNGAFIPHKSGIHSKGAYFSKTKDDITKQDSEKIIKLEKRGKQVEDWWIDIYTTDRVRSELVGYYSQKPKALLERIVKASSNEGDTVADFFCGSGTTLVVAKELNRRYIGCDIGEKAVKITNERLREMA